MTKNPVKSSICDNVDNVDNVDSKKRNTFCKLPHNDFISVSQISILTYVNLYYFHIVKNFYLKICGKVDNLFPK